MTSFCINNIFAQSTISNTKWKGINTGIHFCLGSNDTITFDTTGAFSGANFTVQLSDINGGFGAPTSIGSSISKKIPISILSLPLSTNYSLRVIRDTVIGDTLKLITLTKPTANFTITNNNTCPGTPIAFVSTSTGVGPLVYAWNLNAAATPSSSALPNPSGVIYPTTIGNTSTNYPVKLVVIDFYGCKDSLVTNVIVKHKPQANLIINPFILGTSPLSLQTLLQGAMLVAHIH
ncbi:MAG: hypothetical protein IPK03_06155 [Bacteroidetes bacterium]|nr:hypothetical protein [Bacteroidota bacterium]